MIDNWIFDDNAEFGYIYECPHCKFHLFVDSNDENLRPERCPRCQNIVKRIVDNDKVIKALKCCGVETNCKHCPYHDISFCQDEMCVDALYVIRQQQKEIEKFADIGKIYSEIKSEVRKEFAEKVKEIDGNLFLKADYDGADEFMWFDNESYETYIDNLLNEMEWH